MRKIICLLAVILTFSALGIQTSHAQFLEKDAFVRVQKKLRPAVVRIQKKWLFGFDNEKFIIEGGGTGFIVTKEGHILTNAHVVLDAVEMVVVLHDGSKFIPKLLGYDKKADLAMIKISVPHPLAPAELRDSAKIEVGEMVVAMGNALGYGINVSTGIISAYGFPKDVIERVRSYNNREPLPPIDYIITDAGINPGNSGGPLADLDGRVIGINSAKFSADNMSLTIPINYAKDILETLKQGKPIRDGWIGVLTDYPPPEMAELFKIPKRDGVIITKIVPASPAEKSGLRRNDFVVEVNGRPTPSNQNFEWLIRVAREKAALRLYRMGKELVITVPVIPEPDGGQNSDNKAKPSYDNLKPKR